MEAVRRMEVRKERSMNKLAKRSLMETFGMKLLEVMSRGLGGEKEKKWITN